MENVNKHIEFYAHILLATMIVFLVPDTMKIPIIAYCTHMFQPTNRLVSGLVKKINLNELTNNLG